MRTTKVFVLLALALVAVLAIGGCRPVQEELVLRYSVDHSATQASAFSEEDVLKVKLEELIPNAKVQLYTASSLYKPIETLNQLASGNLEMGSIDSDGAGWDPWINIYAQPMALTTVGAHLEFRNSETAKAFEERMLARGVRVLGWMPESMLGGNAAATRQLSLDDMKGKKIRISAVLTQGPLITSLGANPVAMAFGDVPSALQTGVVDGCLTSVGGFKNIKDLAPYYTCYGMGGVTTDFYMCSVSEKWYQGLDKDLQGKIAEAFTYWTDEFCYWQYAEDTLGYQQFGTTDPSQPGIYIATAEEIAPVKAAVGNSIMDALLAELGEDARWLLELHAKDAAALNARWPMGSHPVEGMSFDGWDKKLRMTS